MTSIINPFAVHYFLWFAGLTSIYGYVSVYAEHYANASTSQYGLLNMVMTFVTILAKLYFCALADRHRAHRLFFVLFIVAALIGYGSFGILPFYIEPQPKSQGLNITAWTLICIMFSIATISSGVISCLGDAYAMNSSSKNNSSYGLIRVWGTLGWGASSLALAFINQSTALPLLVPGLLMTICLLLLDVFVAAFWPTRRDYELDNPEEGAEFENVIATRQQELGQVNHSRRLSYESISQSHGEEASINEVADTSIESFGQTKVSRVKLQWLLFLEVARQRKSIFRYMIIFIISGALISLQWSYFFLYLQNIYPNDFSYISGISMIGQSMVGELPIFILSDWVIRKLGRSHTLSLSVISIGIRYLLYGYLLPNSNMYFVLLTESLQGPSFGLFYVVMTEVGLDYSNCEDAIIVMLDKGLIDNKPSEVRKLRLALCATMQSIMSACYEGLGLGIGSILGGLVINYQGFDHLWLYSSIMAIGLGLFNIIIELLNIPIFGDQKPRSAHIID